MGIFDQFIWMLQEAGVADVLLPFVLVFTIVFAILEKTKILGERNDRPVSNINAMVALVMGFSVVFPHVLRYYSPDRDPVIIINSSLPSVAIIIIAIVMVMMMIGLMSDKEPKISGSGWVSNVAVGGAILAVAFIFLSNSGFLNLHLYITRGTQSAVVALLIFGIIIWAVMKGSGDTGSTSSGDDH